MSTHSAQARLKDATRELLLAWRKAQDDWRDAAAEEFKKEFIEPIEPRVAAAINAMAELGETLASARRELE